MFDFMPRSDHARRTAPPVLFLSNPFGVAGEWSGIAETLGDQADCEAYEDPSAYLRRVCGRPEGPHLVAHGTGAYHALIAAIQHPHCVRSVTLIDPDIICAMPDLIPCPQFRRHTMLVRRAQDLALCGKHRDAAAQVIDWWMGRRAWSKTAFRLKARFAGAMPALADEWRMQAKAPVNLLGLVALACPVKVVTGRRAPSEITELARLLRMAIPEASMVLVKSARAASHLTDPHVVGPELRNFIVSSDLGWHTKGDLVAA